MTTKTKSAKDRRAEAAKAKVMAELREDRKAIQSNEREGVKLRAARNRRIVRASRYAKPGEIGRAAGVSQAFASRVIRDKGKPQSGSVMERRRKEKAK